MPELVPAVPGSPEWLAARRAGVTATDIVTILGLSASSSAYSLYWQKLGQVPEPGDSDRFRLGRQLEPYVVGRWLEDNPAYVASGPHLYRHSDRTWQMATIDRGVTALPATTASAAVLECKSWADADRHSWQDAPPAAVRAQVLWQMDVMNVTTGHVGVVFLPSGEFRSYVIDHTHVLHGRDQFGEYTEYPVERCNFCADLELMRAAGEEFMARLRLELPAPDPDASAATLAAVRARFTRQPDKTAEVDKCIYEEWMEARTLAGEWESLARYQESKLREQAGEASVYTVEGQPVARRIISAQQVKAHTRRMDYLKRIKTEANGDE